MSTISGWIEIHHPGYYIHHPGSEHAHSYSVGRVHLQSD